MNRKFLSILVGIMIVLFLGNILNNEIFNKCILCGSRNTQVFSGEFCPFIVERAFKGRYRYTKFIHCSNCDFNYSLYRPTERELTDLYYDYRGEEYQKLRQKYEPNYTKEFNYYLGHSKEQLDSRINQLSSLVDKFCSVNNIKNVLDYGGDEGQFIPPVFNKTDKYVFEISGVKLKYGIKLIDNLNEVLKKKWDFIMCCHVLEHVSNPKEIFKNLIKITNKNGYLYIELPYEDYMWDQIKTEQPVYFHEHIQQWRNKTLEIFIKNFGGEWNILFNSRLDNGTIAFLAQKIK